MTMNDLRVQKVIGRHPALSELEMRAAELSQRAVKLSRDLSALSREAHNLAQDLCRVNEGGSLS